jgi:hypothetical protein
MKKSFTFRFKLAYEVTLSEDEIYPDYPWYLNPEHSRTYERSKKAKKLLPRLDAAKVLKTVRAAGGPAKIYRDWNLAPGLFDDMKAVRLEIVPARPKRPKRPKRKKST